MARKHKKPDSSKNRRKGLFNYQALEARNLLAGDIMASAFEPAPIYDVFSHDAVTVDQMVERAQHRPFIEGELVVAVEIPASVYNSAELVAQLNWEILTGVQGTQAERTMFTTDLDTDTSVSLVKINLGPGADIIDVMQQLDLSANVMWSSPNFYQTESPIEYIPNDPDYGSQYHHPLMQNDLAWDFTLGDPSIIIGVTDDGVDLPHVDLSANIWSNTGEIPGNLLDDDFNGYVDDADGWDFVNANNNPNPEQVSHDHGTHVAGIAAGTTDNGIGIAGTSGGSTIMPLQFYDYVSADWTAAVINEAFVYAVDNGAHIITTSYNMDGWAGDPVVTAGYQYIWNNDRIHFNSAGNGNSNNTARTVFEQSLLVVSTDSGDLRSSFSNYGTETDISAPGSDVFSTVTSNGYGTKSGTSMAAPNAAGVAALIWSQNPTWSRDQVVAQLLGTADNIDALNPGFEGELGAGRVNPYNAFSQTLAAPQITTLDGLPDDGSSTNDLAVSGFNIRFDQFMAPATANNAANYAVIEAGPDKILGTADDVNVPTTVLNNYMGGSNSIQIEFAGGPLGFGLYQVSVVSGGLTNPFGTALDGDGNGTGGDDFSLTFTVEPPPPVALSPAGSFAYERAFAGSLASGTEVDFQTIDLDAGQTLSVRVVGQPGMNPVISVTGPGGSVIGTVTGVDSLAVLNSVPVDTAGTYQIDVSSDTATTGGYSGGVMLNAAYELEVIGENNTQATAEDLTGDEMTYGSSGRISVVGTLPALSGTPVITENFDSGSFGAGWTTSSTNTFGRIQLTGAFGTAAGANALVMDSNTDSNYVNNEAIWTVDLTGVANPLLAFEHMDWSDEEDSLPASFTGSADGDGVSISDDGINWYTILNATSVSDWTPELFDLNSLATTFGLTLGAGFQIKFQQYDNFELTTDGRGYDEIQILTPDTSADWYKFDVSDGEKFSIAAGTVSGGGSVLAELYDAGGTLLATGTPTANIGSQIAQYTDTTVNGVDDTYYVRLTGGNARYNMMVMRNADFDFEPNDSAGSPMDITDVGGVFGHISQSSVAQLEPDDYAPGTVLDTVFSTVTLSNNVSGGSVFGATAGFGAPTGTIVFGPSATGASGWNEGSNELRADFSSLQATVSIDVGSDDASDVGFLRAYDAGGNLLDEVVSGSISTGGSETITITRPSADIAYVIAAGVGGDVTPMDNLQFNVPGSDDFFGIDAVAGQMIDLTATLPGMGPFHFVNGLDLGGGASDLVMELIDPNGVSVGSNSSQISHTASLNGTYVLRVGTNGGAGEYFINNGDDIITPDGFDFGPAGQTVWSTYVPHADQAYNAGVGYGWQTPVNVTLIDRGAGTPLTRELAQMQNGTFLVDVANGTYNVDVHLGVVRKTDAMRVTIEGSADTFVPLRGLNVTRSYVATVNDGQLTIEFDGLSGLINTVNVSGIGITEVSPRETPQNGKSNPLTANQSPFDNTPWSPVDTTTVTVNPESVSPLQRLGSLSGTTELDSSPGVDRDDVFAGYDIDAEEFELVESFESGLKKSLSSING
ncbi:MAG: S8 family serine peptidase [Planctomycetota bacterium]